MIKYSKETSVGVFVFIGLLCLGYLTIKLGKMEFFDTAAYTVSARFTSVSGLRNGAEVEIAGVPVGKVSDIKLNQDTGAAEVFMKINKDVKLDEDTIASVKTSGLIGDKYIKLSVGGSDVLLKNGDRITDTESAIDLEELISKYIFGGV